MPRARKAAPRGWGSVTPYRGGFRVRISIDGDRIERYLPTEPLANATLEALQQRKVEVESGVASPRGMAEDVRVSDVIPEFLASVETGARHVYTPKTIKTYGIECRHLLRSPIGPRRIMSLRKPDVEQLAVWLRKEGAGTSHVRHIMDRLAQVLRFAHEAQYISKIPVEVKRPKAARNTDKWCPSELEFARLVKEAAGAFDKRALALVLVAGEAGPRIGEAGQLRVRDVDLENGLFHIESRGEVEDRTKNAERRTVPIFTTRCKRAVAALMAGRAPDDLIFGVRDKEAVSDCAGAAWRKAFGFEPRWHGLRRRFARWRALAGDPVPVIQQWLGHSSITTTMGYIIIPEEALRKGAKRGRRVGAKPK